MVDITRKSYSLRKAIATATVLVSSQETMEIINSRKVPKGDVFEFARAAALLAIKKTSDVIPDCHPLPIEFAAIRYRLEDLKIVIEVEVHTIYKTGVEVEAMHGASVASLVIYDMLKPIDKAVEIQNIRLLEKKGGKTDWKDLSIQQLKAKVVVCSDSVLAGKRKDSSGLLLVELLNQYGLQNVQYAVVPDEIKIIQQEIEESKIQNVDLLVFTGGTGLSDRDVTPDAVKPYLTKEIPGVMETARNYGQDRIKTAMLSRSIAGFSDSMLILTLPGSKNAVQEYMDALFPQLFHVFQVKDGESHG